MYSKFPASAHLVHCSSELFIPRARDDMASYASSSSNTPATPGFFSSSYCPYNPQHKARRSTLMEESPRPSTSFYENKSLRRTSKVSIKPLICDYCPSSAAGIRDHPSQRVTVCNYA